MINSFLEEFGRRSESGWVRSSSIREVEILERFICISNRSGGVCGGAGRNVVRKVAVFPNIYGNGYDSDKS